MKEIDLQQQNNDQIKPEFVDEMFGQLNDPEISGNEMKHGRKPNRANRIRNVFRGRENEAVTLDDVAAEFATTDNPRKSASNAISWLNKEFESKNLRIEIETTTVGGRRPNQTTYRLRRWPHE